MRHLLVKEFKLAAHPTAWLFIPLSLMMLIPNYPYYVIFFYTGLGVFFTCLMGRENRDIPYTLSLPVPKRDIVKARYAMVVLLQLLQVISAIPFALLRQSFDMPGNGVGMDANIAFFGLNFIMLGLFNLVFFGIYYKNVDKVGVAFVTSSIVVFFYMIVAEACTHAVPFFKTYLDTKDTEYLSYKLIVLTAGILIYAVLTLLSMRRSIKTFEALDL